MNESPETKTKKIENGICKSCNKPIQEQFNLPFQPDTNQDFHFEGKPYHPGCLNELLEKQHPNKTVEVKLKLNARSAFLLQQMLRAECESTISNLSESWKNAGAEKVQRRLTVALSEHEAFYVQCANCPTLLLRSEASEGEETKAFLKTRPSNSELSIKNRFSETRHIAMFCSSLCDLQYASRLKLYAAKEDAELLEKENRKKKPKLTFKQMLSILEKKVTGDDENEAREAREILLSLLNDAEAKNAKEES